MLAYAVVACMVVVSTAPVFAQGNEPLQPLPPLPKLDPLKVALGEQLFNDPRLSKDDTVSCASCHIFALGGSNGQIVATGVNGAKGAVNTPTVFNSSLNFRQFWDGRAATLEEQAAGPITNPVEMASAWPDVIAKLSKDASLVARFKAIYPADGVSPQSIADAIATYERTLLTPDSRFDKYLRGDTTALTADEQRGYQLFKSYGCVSCHQGVNIGGNMYQTFGVMNDYFTQRGNPTPADLGRYNVTHKEKDKHVFKVPSLRNVALTAPYFHDGSARTLMDVENVMFKYQLGREAPVQDKELIIKFLNTLTGEFQGKPLQPAN